VTCSSSDTHGNTSSQKFNVTVQDTTPPVISGMPSDRSAEATGPAGTIVSWTAPTATDLVDGPRPVTCAPTSGSTFALGTTTVSCTSTDSHGNTSKASTFAVTVQDTTPPALTVPASLTAEATGPGGAAVTYPAATALDVVDGSVTPSCAPASGGVFPLGTTTVVCAAGDAHGNKATGSFNVTVQDTTGPAMVVPADLTVEGNTLGGAVVTFTATATDLVDGPRPVACVPASGNTFPVGTTKVTCSSADTRSNTSEATFSVTVQDTTAPKLSLPGNLAATATSAGGAVVTYATSAADVVDGTVAVACDRPSGSLFAPGTTVVSCSAKDRAGNTATATFTVNVTFGWGGFQPPVTLDGRSAFKLGSTIPVKIALAGASAGVTDLQPKLYVTQVYGQPVGDQLQPNSTSAADSGNTFRYAGSPGQYIFNVSTKTVVAGGTWWFYADLGDGVPHAVQVSIR